MARHPNPERRSGRLEQIIDSIGAFVAILDPDGRLTDVDADALAVGGHARAAVTGAFFWDAPWWSHDASAGAALRAAVDAARGGEVSELDLVARIAGDGRLPVRVRVSPVFEGEAVTDIVVSGVDQSGLRRAEDRRALSAAEAERRLAELEALYEALPVGVALHDREMRFLRVNRLMAEMDGIPVEDHIGRKGDELLPGVDPHISRIIRTMFDTGEPVLGLEVKAETPAKPGVMRDFVADYYPVTLKGEVVAVGTCVREVTEERRLREDLRSVLDSTLALVTVIGRDGAVLDVNAAARTLFGLDRERVLGAPFHHVLWTSPGDSSALVRDAVDLALQGQGVRFDVEFETPAGETGVLDLMLAPQSGADGSVRRVIASAFDITDRKEAAERIDLLLQEVNHRSKNLLSLVQAVARQTRGRDVAEFRDKFQRRLAGLSAAQDLVTAHDWRDVALGDLVRNQLAAFAGELGARVALDGPDDVRISARAAQTLGMAFHELMTNAGKYGALSTDTGRVSLTWRRGDDGLELSWVERGGPPVTAPQSAGFGSLVIDSVVSEGLGGSVEINYAPQGLEWRVTGARTSDRPDGTPGPSDRDAAGGAFKGPDK